MTLRRRDVLATGALVVTLAMVSCAPRPADKAETGNDKTSSQFGLSLAGEVKTTTAEGLTVHPGDVTLPRTLAERTVLEGAIPSITSSPGVIGCVVDVYGTPENGECRIGNIHTSAVTPNSILKTDVTPGLKAASQIHFNDIVEKQSKLEAGYLAFSASMQRDDRCEVMIEDVAEQSIDKFDSDVDATKLAAFEARPLPNGACGRYVITRLALTAIKYRTYTSKEDRAGVASIIKIGGRRYYSHTKQVNDLVLGVVLRPIGYSSGQRKPMRSLPAPITVKVLK